MSRVALAALLLVVTACTTPSVSPTPGATSLTVVATTTVIADFVREIGGERVTVRALVPAGGEAHTFDPAPSDAALLGDADLLVMNGLGLDDWVRPFAEQAGATDAPVLALAENQIEVDYIDENPHLWLDPTYAELYADQIRLKLIELDPAGQDEYDAGAAAFAQRLDDTDADIGALLDSIPADQRRIVSFHDAFPYFARAYGLEIVGVLVEAPGQEPSPAEIAGLVEAIRVSGARAILAEAQFSDELAQTVAAETDAVVVTELYTDSLGDAPADTYVGALRWNAEQIAAALQ